MPTTPATVQGFHLQLLISSHTIDGPRYQRPFKLLRHGYEFLRLTAYQGIGEIQMRGAGDLTVKRRPNVTHGHLAIDLGGKVDLPDPLLRKRRRVKIRYR